MAREWIKWMKGLAGRSEIRAIARTLGITRHAAAGHFMAMMDWADDETTDGTMPGITLADIDDAAGLVGFGKSLVDQGWAAADDRGITLLRFKRHNGETAKKRAVDAENKRNQRDTPECPIDDRTERGQRSDQNKNKSRKENTTIRRPAAAPLGGGEVEGDGQSGQQPAGAAAAADPTESQQRLVQTLQREPWGLRPRKAADIVSSHPESVIAAAMRMAREPGVKKPAGFLIAKLETGEAAEESARHVNTESRRAKAAATQYENAEAARVEAAAETSAREAQRQRVRDVLHSDGVMLDRLVAEFRRDPLHAIVSRREVTTERLLARVSFLDWAAERMAAGGAA